MSLEVLSHKERKKEVRKSKKPEDNIELYTQYVIARLTQINNEISAKLYNLIVDLPSEIKSHLK